jgi:thiol:disulfide interchange protein
MARIEPENQRTVPPLLYIVAAVLLVARIVYLALPEKKEVDHTLVQWTPLSRVQALAARTHKPILYDFSAAWCGPCRQMEKEVFSNAALAAEINRRVIAVKITDRQREDGMNKPEIATLLRRYGVEVFPTLVVAGENGAQRMRMEGFRGREAFASLLRNATRTPLR